LRAAAAEASSATGAAAVGDVDNNATTVGVDVAAAIRARIDPTKGKEEFLPAEQGRMGPMGLPFACSGRLWWLALHLSQYSDQLFALHHSQALSGARLLPEGFIDLPGPHQREEAPALPRIFHEDQEEHDGGGKDSVLRCSSLKMFYLFYLF
jgi:hypothetical protein